MGEINEVYIGLFDSTFLSLFSLDLNELEISDLGSSEIQKLKLILEEYYNLITVVQVTLLIDIAIHALSTLY